MFRLLLLAALSLPAAGAEPPRVLVLGDSLSAGYGLSRESGWTWLLEERIRTLGLPHRVVNASVSGDTTAGGLTRLASLLEREKPEVLVIELGANDGLRGFGFDLIRENLTALVREGRSAGARVLILGVRLPPNYGAAYTEGFQAVFRQVADAEGVPLVPQMLAGVAEDRGLMQADGIHPAAAAQPRILDNVWPALEPLLKAASPGS
jgi:acyl-CoA thioesterase-1